MKQLGSGRMNVFRFARFYKAEVAPRLPRSRTEPHRYETTLNLLSTQPCLMSFLGGRYVAFFHGWQKGLQLKRTDVAASRPSHVENSSLSLCSSQVRYIGTCSEHGNTYESKTRAGRQTSSRCKSSLTEYVRLCLICLQGVVIRQLYRSRR